MDAIEVRDLRKVYGAKAAVDGLSFTVPQGSFFGFLGPNGAGRTTTMRRNGVIDITAAGSRVIKVSSMTICMGTLSEAPPFPAVMPNRESGSAEVEAAVAGRARRNTVRSALA